MKRHSYSRTLAAFFLVSTLAVPSFGQNARAVAPVNDDARVLLEEIASATAGLRQICADFRQEKHLSYMEGPLVSEGRLFFMRNNASETLVWEYRAPMPSGFIMRKGKGSVWTRERSSLHPAAGPESQLLQVMLKQVRAFINIQPDTLTKSYNIRRNGPDGLTLVPREKAFFSSLDIFFSTDRLEIRRICFVEPEGRTELFFTPCAAGVSLPQEYGQ